MEMLDIEPGSSGRAQQPVFFATGPWLPPKLILFEGSFLTVRFCTSILGFCTLVGFGVLVCIVVICSERASHCVEQSSLKFKNFLFLRIPCAGIKGVQHHTNLYERVSCAHILFLSQPKGEFAVGFFCFVLFKKTSALY